MINRVTLVGRIGSKPEIKITTSDNKMARLSLATSEKYKNKKGELEEKTQWHRIVVFNPRFADTIEKYVDKGRLIYLEGQIETRSYEDQGTTKYVTEIVVPTFSGQFRMLDSKGGGSGKTTDTAKESTKEEKEIEEAEIPY